MSFREMASLVEAEYEIKDVVYLVTDPEQTPWIVTAVILRDTCINYELSHGTETREFYAFEITPEKKFDF